MKKIMTVFVLLSLFGFCNKMIGQVFQNKDLTITKLESNMWVLETSDKTTMYLVEGTQKTLLIDTGTRTAKLDSIVSLLRKNLLK